MYFFQFLCILLLFPKLVFSSLFMAAKTSITQDIVWVYSNASTLIHIDNRQSPVFYDDHIQQAENSVVPNEIGIKGVLYPTCHNTLWLEDLPKTISKIALISDQCHIVDSILQAQMNGAIGAIVYGNDTMMVSAGINTTLTIYMVSVQIGKELMDKIVLYKNIPATSLSQSIQVKSYVRVLLLPASSSGINPWEITLLIISILLVTSLFASIIAHWRIRKKKRRQAYLIEQGLIPMPVEMLPMGKNILETSKLDELFPAIIVEGHSQDPSMCVVCLEAMTVNQTIRVLPCKHEFHRLCIDPWLTSKCAECPICKYDCYEK